MSVATQTPASAGPHCAAGNHCGYLHGLTPEPKERWSFSNTGHSNLHLYYFDDGGWGRTGTPVGDNVSAASNSSTGGWRTDWHYNVGNYRGGGGLAFCVNPGSWVQNLGGDNIPGNGIGHSDEASAVWISTSTGYHPWCF